MVADRRRSRSPEDRPPPGRATGEEQAPSRGCRQHGCCRPPDSGAPERAVRACCQVSTQWARCVPPAGVCSATRFSTLLRRCSIADDVAPVENDARASTRMVRPSRSSRWTVVPRPNGFDERPLETAAISTTGIRQVRSCWWTITSSAMNSTRRRAERTGRATSGANNTALVTPMATPPIRVKNTTRRAPVTAKNVAATHHATCHPCGSLMASGAEPRILGSGSASLRMRRKEALHDIQRLLAPAGSVLPDPVQEKLSGGAKVWRHRG